MIYVNPRKDNQSYKGKIVYVNQERGYCVQLVGQRSLFVYGLDRFENFPKVGEILRIFCGEETQKVKVQFIKDYYGVHEIRR